MSDYSATPYQRASARLASRGYFVSGVESIGRGIGWDEYSATAGDYWSAADDAPLGALVRRHHRYRTVSGRWVVAPRVVKSDATVGDLRRLESAAYGRPFGGRKDGAR